MKQLKHDCSGRHVFSVTGFQWERCIGCCALAWPSLQGQSNTIHFSSSRIRFHSYCLSSSFGKLDIWIAQLLRAARKQGITIVDSLRCFLCGGGNLRMGSYKGWSSLSLTTFLKPLFLNRRLLRKGSFLSKVTSHVVNFERVVLY